MVILGIDPGSVRIGFGIIEKRSGAFYYIENGILDVKSKTENERFLFIERELSKLIEEYKPSRIGVEKLFSFKNKKTVIEVAEARGVILATVEKFRIPLYEPTPLEVKQAVTGNGKASKESVSKMVHLFLPDKPKQREYDDAVDALAIAITASTMK